MFFGDGEAEAFHGGKEIFPDQPFQRDVLVVQEVTRVKGQANGDAIQFPPTSPQAAVCVAVGVEVCVAVGRLS